MKSFLLAFLVLVLVLASCCLTIGWAATPGAGGRVPVSTATNPTLNHAKFHEQHVASTFSVNYAALDWTSKGRASPDSRIQGTPGSVVMFALKLRDAEQLEKLALDISNPASPNYGQYWTLEEVDQAFAPEPKDVETVIAHIKETTAMVGDASDARVEIVRSGMIVLLHEPSAAEIESLFGVEMHMYVHGSSKHTWIVRPAMNSQPSLPEEVAEVVSFVGGFTDFVHQSHLVSGRARNAKPRQKPKSESKTSSKKASENKPRGSVKSSEGNVLNAAPMFAISPFPVDNLPIGSVSSMVKAVGDGNDAVLEVALPCFNSSGPFVINMLGSASVPLPPSCEQFGLITPSFMIDVCEVILGDDASPPCIFNTLAASAILPDGAPFVYAKMTISESLVRQGATYQGILVAYVSSSQLNITKTFSDVFFRLSATSDPTELQTIYSVPQNMRMSFSGAFPNMQEWEDREGVLVAQFVGESYLDSDLALFTDALGFGRARVDKFGDGNATAGVQFGYGEGTLDIQTIVAMGRGLRHSFYSTLNQDFHSGFVIYASLIPTFRPASFVHSISWGDPEPMWGTAAMAQVDQYFQQAALMGYTIVLASGDDGVLDNLFPIQGFCTCAMWCTDFPASSPWVLGVGGTMRIRGGTSRLTLDYASSAIFSDVGVSAEYGGMIDSGGGYSQVHPKPDYQRGFGVEYEEYFKMMNPAMAPSIHFENRQVPDIAVSAQSFTTFMQGEFRWTGGTSASAPLTASMLALMNDRLVKSGKPRVGFVNPMLYQAARTFPESFTDVRFGSNKQTRGVGAKCPTSHMAFEGWDAVSGLGNPDFSSILSVLLSNGLTAGPQYTFAGAGPLGPQGASIKGATGNENPAKGASIAAIIFALMALFASAAAILLALKSRGAASSADGGSYAKY
eukprot:ANDGO_03623.mRNA.1 Tripeptidyl-peptidase 1